jgi:hypothetical protein
MGGGQVGSFPSIARGLGQPGDVRGPDVTAGEALTAMASPHVRYLAAGCPHEGCGTAMGFIDFKLELHGDPKGIYAPLVLAFMRSGFAGRCPGCNGWIRFTTSEMSVVEEDRAWPRLPDNWHGVAQIE